MNASVKKKADDPYEEGWVAFTDMKEESANPYPRGTDAYQLWLEGFREGEKDWEDLCNREVAAGRPHPDSL